MRELLRVGLVVNPVAGLGGTVALRGSDGVDIQRRALALGAKPVAAERARRALESCASVHARLRVLTWGGAMGADVARGFAFDWQSLGEPARPSSAADTRRAVQAFAAAGIDVLLFAGGDGTARDIIDAALPATLPVIGVPAGVKMHSGVFTVTPEDAGTLLARLVQGELVAATTAEVRDIDEQALREGRLDTRWHGELSVPRIGGYLQHAKSGGREDEALVVEEIAAWIAEKLLERGGTAMLGAGGTLMAIKHRLGIEGTLLGVDLIRDGALIERDADARTLEARVTEDAVLVLSFTRVQGFLLGRGNQQLSPDVLRRIARENLWVVGTRTKLATLEGRPLALDTGDPALDRHLAGVIEIVTGYEDACYYRVGAT